MDSWLHHAAPDGLAPGLLFDVRGDDPLQQFILGLSVAYNDLKDLHVVMTWLAAMPTDGPGGETHSQQRDGMIIQQSKRAFACIHGILELLTAHRKLLRQPEVTRLLDRLSPRFRADWDAMADVALGRKDDPKSEMARKLAKIRHNFSAHYHQPRALLRGYQRRFFHDSKHPRTRFALFAIGKDLEDSRFHFADVAVEGGMFDIIAPADIAPFVEEWGDLVESVNRAIFGLVREYLRSRGWVET